MVGANGLYPFGCRFESYLAHQVSLKCKVKSLSSHGRIGALMADAKTDPGLMKQADEVFWDEFNQIDRPGDRYIVIDSKNKTVVSQNARLIRETKKVRV